MLLKALTSMSINGSTKALCCWIVFSGLALFMNQANAQGCCTPGTTALGGVERGIAPYQTLLVGLSYQNNDLEDAFESTHRIPDPLGRTATVTALNLEIEYGLTDRVSLVVNSNYLTKRRELTVRSSSSSFPEIVGFTGRGFGDIIVLAKYQLLTPTITAPLEIGIGGGAKLPIGSYEQESDGSRLAIDLQPGTGASDLLAWGFVLRTFPEYRLRFYANALYRYSGTNLDNYRLGDEALFIIGGEYGVLEYLGLSLLAKGRFARQDFSNGRLLPSTGGQTYSIVPGAIYREGHSNVRVFFQLPLYRNVNGIQLTLTRLVGLELQYVFDFRGG